MVNIANKHIFIIKLTVRELGKAVGQTEARRSEKKNLFETPSPLISQGLYDRRQNLFSTKFSGPYLGLEEGKGNC